MSVDPTPPLPLGTPLEELRRILLDPQQRMFDVRRAPPPRRHGAAAPRRGGRILYQQAGGSHPRSGRSGTCAREPATSCLLY